MLFKRILGKIRRSLALVPIKDFTSWNHFPDTKLYNDAGYCLDSNEHHPVSEKLLFHSFWNGKIDRKQAFAIKSCLCTQDMSNAEIWLWLDKENGYEGYAQNQYLQPLLPFIKVKCFDLQVALSETTVGKQLGGYDFKGDYAHKSDAFRFITLHNHGGVYFDLDVMFLKDFRELVKNEFCYAWENQSYANSAVCSLRKKGMMAQYLLQKCVKETYFYPWTILNYGDKWLSPMFVYPCAFFDPVWQPVQRSPAVPIIAFDEFFRPFEGSFCNDYNIRSFKDFFPGAYAFHWHNQWKTKEVNESYFGIFEAEMDKALKIRI